MNTSYRGITCQPFLSQWSVDNHISLGTVYRTQGQKEFCRTGQKTIQQEEAQPVNVKALSTSAEPFCEGRQQGTGQNNALNHTRKPSKHLPLK